MKELFLHIGFGKCASSSIQNLLTSQPLFKVNGRTHKFISFKKKESGLLAGKSGQVLLTPKEIAAYQHYPPNYKFTNLSHEPRVMKHQLDLVKKDPADVGVMSTELLSDPRLITPELISNFSALKMPITLFMVVRPFTEWLNSAWWQWGAFDKYSPEVWLSNHSAHVYRKVLDRWLSLPNLKQHYVVDIRNSPVEKMCSILGLTSKKRPWRNVSTCAELLRYLIINKETVGRRVNDPFIEFVLNEEIDFHGSPPPFVVSNRKKEDVAQQYRDLIQSDTCEKLKSIIQIYLSNLEYELLNSPPYTTKEFDFKNFLNEKPSPEFQFKIDELLTRRKLVPKDFTSSKYFFLNPDVDRSGMNAYTHYLKYGKREGRRIC